MKDNVVVIIPTYNPSDELEKLVSNLEKSQYTTIIVVNDGSQRKENLKNIEDKVILLENKKNEGKGNALKKAIRYTIQHIPEIKGIITVDSDGQHKIEDINNIYKMFQKNENDIILGCRDLNKKTVPFRSKIGNKIICYILNKKYNKKLKDTQTGLRAIPEKYLKSILSLKGERYEYELNTLLYYIKNHIPIIEVPIQTIYINKNKASHYKMIQDSCKIGKMLN